MTPLTVDLEDFEHEDLEDEDETNGVIHVFLMATYGEGEPTDSAVEFYEWLIDDDCDDR